MSADKPSTAAPQPKRRRRPGAPAKNKNAMTSGLRAARLPADRFSRNAQRLVKDLLRHYGLEADPHARLIGRQVRRLESAAARLEDRGHKRGFFDAKGAVNSTLTTLISVTDRLLGEARSLLDRLGDLRPAPTQDVIRTVTIADGREYTPVAVGLPPRTAE